MGACLIGMSNDIAPPGGRKGERRLVPPPPRLGASRRSPYCKNSGLLTFVSGTAVLTLDRPLAFRALFNEVYDTEHVPNLLQVPGVRSVTRMKGEAARFAIAGGVRELPAPSPIYTAIYEIDDPQVLESPQWAEAVERGRWPSEVRPHTSNRQHLLFKVQ